MFDRSRVYAKRRVLLRLRFKVLFQTRLGLPYVVLQRSGGHLYMFNNFGSNCDFSSNFDGLTRCVYNNINGFITGKNCVTEGNFPFAIFRNGQERYVIIIIIASNLPSSLAQLLFKEKRLYVVRNGKMDRLSKILIPYSKRAQLEEQNYICQRHRYCGFDKNSFHSIVFSIAVNQEIK